MTVLKTIENIWNKSKYLHPAYFYGRPIMELGVEETMNYVENLRSDTGMNYSGEMGGLMADRLLWRKRINTWRLKPP